MSAARRPLLTATTAGALLTALWFIPTAHATADRMTPAADARPGDTPAVGHGAVSEPGTATLIASDTAGTRTGTNATRWRPAGTGSAESSPYLFGGTVLLGLGAGFVAYSARRGHTSAN